MSKIIWNVRTEKQSELIYSVDNFHFIWNQIYKTLSHVKFNFKIVHEIDFDSLEDAENWIINILQTKK